MTTTLLSGLVLFSAIQAAIANPAISHRYPHLTSRSLITQAEASDAYDFVIVGGGLAGLTLAGRLSEDSSFSILVLEAGSNGDEVRERIDTPGVAYYNGILNGDRDWNYTTTAQSMVNNRELRWPMGRVIGGSSAANGMYLVRPSNDEVTAWHSLVKDQDGADNWTPTTFFDAMRRSETFTPPLSSLDVEISYTESSHGKTGPIHATYPAYHPPHVAAWIPSLEMIGVPETSDAYNGEAWGAFIATSAINPTNWTRSYSRTGYIDPYVQPNLHILANSHVTRIVFDGKTAVGVEYGDGRRVTANKEVILCAGAVGSPATLLRSGVGPRDVLSTANVDLVHELPGVGQHLQDHIATGVIYNTTAETSASIYWSETDSRRRTPEFLSYINGAVAYVNTSQLVGDWDSDFRVAVMANLTQSVRDLLPSQDPTIIEGYKAVYTLLGDTLLNGPTGQVELLLSTMGTSAGANSIAIQVALQRPFSHGHLWLNPDNVQGPPVIDPAYLSHPADIIMLREGLKMARYLASTDPLKSLLGGEVTPGSGVSTDAEWEDWLRTDVHTEFHPSCTCSMMPLELGGVVDANLKVHGLEHIRVVDASVFPIEFSAHMMAPTYGLAEQAALIIRDFYKPGTVTRTASAAAPTGSSTSNKSNGASASFSPSFTFAFCISNALFLLWTVL